MALCLCLSVCLSRIGVLSKQLDRRSLSQVKAKLCVYSMNPSRGLTSGNWYLSLLASAAKTRLFSMAKLRDRLSLGLYLRHCNGIIITDSESLM